MSFMDQFMKGLAGGLPMGFQREQYQDQRYDQRMGRERIAEADKQAAIAKAEHEAELAEYEKTQDLEQQGVADLMSNMMLGEEYQQPAGGFFPGQDTPTGYEQPLGDVNPALMKVLQGGDYNAIMNATGVMGQLGIPLYEPREEATPDEFSFDQLLGAMGMQHQGAPMLQIAENAPELGLGAEAEWVRENSDIATQLFESMAPQPEQITPFTLGDTQVRYFPTEEGGLTPIYNEGYGQEDTGRTGMRTDRHNNPTAMTTDVARTFGLVEGVDYMIGDPFPDNPNLYTATLIGDGMDVTIKALDGAANSTSQSAFYTQGGQPRWNYTAISDEEWMAKTPEQKADFINGMYQMEGGAYTSSGFRGVQTAEADAQEMGGFETWDETERKDWWGKAGGWIDEDLNYQPAAGLTFSDTQNRAEYLRELEGTVVPAETEQASARTIEATINDYIAAYDSGVTIEDIMAELQGYLNDDTISAEDFTAIGQALGAHISE